MNSTPNTFEKSDSILRDIRDKRSMSRKLFNEAVALKQVYIREFVREAQHLKNHWIVIPEDGVDNYYHCTGIYTAPIVAWIDVDVRTKDWNVHTDYVEMYFDCAGCIIDGEIRYQEYVGGTHTRFTPADLRTARIVAEADLP